MRGSGRIESFGTTKKGHENLSPTTCIPPSVNMSQLCKCPSNHDGGLEVDMISVQSGLAQTTWEDELPNRHNVLLGLPQVLHLLPQLVEDGEGRRHAGLAGPGLEAGHLRLFVLLDLQLPERPEQRGKVRW